MHPHLRAVLVAFALVLVPQIASAGPISWSYTGSVTGDGGDPNLLYLGPQTRPDAFSPDGFRHGNIFGSLATSNGSGTFTGSAQFQLGGLVNGSVNVLWLDSDPQPSAPFSNNFVADLAIVDTASGARGDFRINGTGDLNGDPMLASYTLRVLLDPNFTQQQVLGNNLYQVQFSTETTSTGAWVAADVTVTSATPEPGTFALAGLGIGAFGLLRLRRRSPSLSNVPC